MSNELETCAHGFASKLVASSAPRVLFFPSSGREGASLLRAYYISDALKERGWISACVSPLIKQSARRRIIHCFCPDLLVYQQCRHPLNNGDITYGIPYVLDTDDADFYLTVPGLVERLEQTSQKAEGVIAGSRFIEAWHLQRNPNTTVIWTGTPISQNSYPKHSDRQATGHPILAWAQAKPLHYHRELDFVVRLAKELKKQGLFFKLRLYGVASEEECNILKHRVSDAVDTEFMPPMDYNNFLHSLHDVAVGLSPIATTSPFSKGKSFGKILGYLDAGVPVIASDEADHSLFFNDRNGFVSNNFKSWVEVASKWLKDPEERQRISNSAYIDFQKRLSIKAAADQTDIFLRNLLKK